MPPRRVFLDSVFAIALSVSGDQYHELAKALSAQLDSERAILVTTRPILLEIGDSLARQRYRQAAISLLEALEDDPTVEIVELSDELYAQAHELYARRADKEWGLTDCVSFVVMREQGLMEALTADAHFQQAGFRALLR